MTNTATFWDHSSELPARSSDPVIYFFGYISKDRRGHHLYRMPNWTVDEADAEKFPLKDYELDSHLCPKRQMGQSFGKLLHKDGWTYFSFWDYTGDKRPGSNSNFFCQGIYSAKEILLMARKRYPQVFERLKQFPFTEVNKEENQIRYVDLD